MKQLITFLLFVLFLSSSTFAQNVRDEYYSSPLGTAFYLLKNDQTYPKSVEDLADAYFEVGEYEKSLKCLELESNEYSRLIQQANFAQKLIDKKQFNTANIYLDSALKLLQDVDDYEWQDSYIQKMASYLIVLDREEDAKKVLSKQESKLNRIRVNNLIGIAFYNLGQKAKALRYFNESYKLINLSSSNVTEFAQTGLYFAKLGNKKNTLEIANQIEYLFSKGDSSYKTDLLLMLLVRLHLELKNIPKAITVWQNYGNFENNWQLNTFSSMLIENNQKELAKPYLYKLFNNKEYLKARGDDITNHFLSMDDIEKAKEVALTMSKDNDNYSQQTALMKVADWYIKNSNISEALKILDFAFQKAKKIEYIHLTEHSIGASPGSRKEIYLRNIFKRLMHLKQYKKALLTIQAINTDHEDAKEFLAEYLVHFASQQYNTLPKDKVLEILDTAKTLTSNESDFYLIKYNLLLADTLAKQNEKQKAVDLIVTVLSKVEDSSYTLKPILIETGKIFSKHKLKPNEKLKKILREIIKQKTT